MTITVFYDEWKSVIKISLTFFKALKFSMKRVSNLFSNIFLLSETASFTVKILYENMGMQKFNCVRGVFIILSNI